MNHGMHPFDENDYKTKKKNNIKAKTYHHHPLRIQKIPVILMMVEQNLILRFNNHNHNLKNKNQKLLKLQNSNAVV